MKIGILGAGHVGKTLAAALLSKGHTIMLGSRQPEKSNLPAGLQKYADACRIGTHAATALFGEVLFLCVPAQGVAGIVTQLLKEAVQEKLLIDVTNPLDFSQGSPPAMMEGYGSHWSMGEAVQNWLPHTRVVKALNTVTAQLMVNADLVNDGHHHLFICGNDIEAKHRAKHILAENFQWKPEYMIDMGGIRAARLTETIIPFWVGVMHVKGTPLFNYLIVD